ncbi:BrxA/BrxB family bacilliredoxin [Alicyclobacillus sp. SO9]|uniref:BrxA/BrxB family bacilliredoxin n=1 Tax=Alicyclobacillus sp. SO9 TaxID=2665646 RepID=UPI0018E6EA84|nr:BrxA/BrxB family bacilliredoxin [Alicyclobacillus sp. SO9]QQE77431.1 BrxA/BrxB family bacilliredoxin [Alicyclobacillus sp. SO9]
MSLELDFYAMMVQPMRDELTEIGFRELRTAEEVDEALGNKDGTTLVFVNSVCGCAGGIARPAAGMALQSEVHPDNLVTVFAGQDKDATKRAREQYINMPPSSPSIFLFKNGEVVDALHRSDIEGFDADVVAARLQEMFKQHCAA